jgi:serine/threonine protein kinase
LANCDSTDVIPYRAAGVEEDGALSGWGYIVTGLASTSLHAVAASGSPPGEVIWAMTLSIARGLRYMHARDLVHCDVKPANILCYHNRWVLGDLGLAQRAGTAQPEGTIGYTAPERFDGIVSPKSDVYALGVTLHVAMSSERLREESTLETPTIEHI